MECSSLSVNLNLNFSILYSQLSAELHKCETDEKLSVVNANFMKITDFMRVSGVQISKIGKLK